MVSTFILKTWSNEPRTLTEQMVWDLVTSKACLGTFIHWKGATKEPFLAMQAQGQVKLQIVVRMTEGVVTCHFWQDTDGGRTYLKIKTT